LEEAIKSQIEIKRKQKLKNEFCPEWRNLQTWINQRGWEDELGEKNYIPKPKVNPFETKKTPEEEERIQKEQERIKHCKFVTTKARI
jgi:hypothetical protein